MPAKLAKSVEINIPVAWFDGLYGCKTQYQICRGKYENNKNRGRCVFTKQWKPLIYQKMPSY